MGDIQSPLPDLCQCHLQGFALSCPGIFFSQVNAQTELMMKRKYKKLKVVEPYVHCCIKCPQILQVKTLLQMYTAFTCMIYNKILKRSI